MQARQFNPFPPPFPPSHLPITHISPLTVLPITSFTRHEPINTQTQIYIRPTLCKYTPRGSEHLRFVPSYTRSPPPEITSHHITSQSVIRRPARIRPSSLTWHNKAHSTRPRVPVAGTHMYELAVWYVYLFVSRLTATARSRNLPLFCLDYLRR